MNPDVSVIIPTYNRSGMVVEAVMSVTAQRDVSFEVIVVDDGSEDDTIERLRAGFADDSKIRIASIPHRGVAAARNFGVAMARAEFVAFLDSDDLWMPDKLARQLAFMNANSEYAFAQTQELWIRNGRRANPGRRHAKRAGDIFLDSLRTCLISPSAMMIRRDLFTAASGFDERMDACEDYDLWLRRLVDYEVGLLDEALVIRRGGHADQLSATTRALDRFRIITLLKLIKMPALSAARRTAVAQVLVEKCAIYAHGLERRGNFADAKYYRRLAQGSITSLDAACQQTATAQ
jgi:glycosyltransferase involved in cell wall biosynthesis